MKTPVQQLLSHLGECHAELRTAYNATDPAIRETAPPSGGWSIAQIVQHLAITDRRLGQLLSKYIDDLGMDEPEEVDIAALVQRRRMQAVLDRSTRVESLEFFKPTEPLTASEAWQKLEQARSALEATVLRAEGVPLSRGKFVHNVLGEMNLYETLVFAGQHKRRHAAQIVEVAQSLSQIAP